MFQWLGLDDRRAAAALFGCLAVVVLLLGVLPAWLHHREAADYAGAAEKTAPGYVSLVTISPVSQGGGGLFNAVAVTFAGRQHYYALPPRSRWDPIYGQPVTVSFRVGRSGDVQVDDVRPDTAPTSPPAAPGPR
jgi:hypothetical protein